MGLLSFVSAIITLVYVIAVTVKFWRMANDIRRQIALLEAVVNHGALLANSAINQERTIGAMNSQLAKLVIASWGSASPKAEVNPSAG
ncbi:MAG: hypothetical protein ACRD1J_02340 [Terriglobia bacterium]